MSASISLWGGDYTFANRTQLQKSLVGFAHCGRYIFPSRTTLCHILRLRDRAGVRDSNRRDLQCRELATDSSAAYSAW